MEFLGKLEMFTPTVENQFVFDLFNLLLCGVIVLVILRGWRAHTRPDQSRNQLLIFLAFSLLGASFAAGAVFAGASLFFRSRLPESSFNLLSHALQAGAWFLLGASSFYRPRGQQEKLVPVGGSFLSFWPLIPLCAYQASQLAALSSKLTALADKTNPLLLALALVLFYRRPLGRRHIATVALALLFVVALLHLGSSFQPYTKGAVVLWNLEQFTWSLSLFTFALAIGETSQDLFDKVFVRLQVAFIVLASFMILVIIQTEKTEYVASTRSRSKQLADFVRAHVDYFRARNQSLSAIIEQEDFLQRMTLGFGNLPELKLVRIITGSQVASFEIADDAKIHRALESLPPTRSAPRLETEEYFPINSLPLAVAHPGEVQFYITREFLDQHIRKRILLIFSLFTAMVALSTLMIGLVVRGASATIRRQAREIEQAQQQLLQTSKLAAIGELAAGVAHEINNPATTILSMASFWLSQEGRDDSPGDPEDVEEVVDQAQRIAQITSALLMFSRRQALDIKAVSMDRVIETGLRSVDEQLAANQISVEKKLRPDLPRVLVDEDSLIRALQNLFRNAIDAMPDGGTLQISTAKDDPWGTRVCLEIADSGIGIEKDNLARIFDPFFTTKEVGKGTGLGLSIVHGIIKEHQGTIAVESQPGVGSKFVIILPTEEQR